MKTNIKTGCSVPAVVRDVLVARGVNYATALEISEQVNAILSGTDWLELYNGTTYDLGFIPQKVTR